MSDEDRYGFGLSEESLKHVEAGAAAHRAALEVNRALNDQLNHIKVELAKSNTENDQLRINSHDLAAKFAEIEQKLHVEIANRAEYWNTIQAVAALILNVKQRVDPAVSSEERPQAVLTGARVPQDAKNGGGGDLPRASFSARSRLAPVPEPGSER